MMDKKRRTAYRLMRAGLRYHQGDEFSHVVFGFPRGEEVDGRTLLKKLTQWIKRENDLRIANFRVTVRENTEFTDMNLTKWNNVPPEKRWRTHFHVLWNAPYIRQPAIVNKCLRYLDDENSNIHVDIKHLNSEKKAASYLLQYIGYQQSSYTYTKSRNWLPKGYDAEFKAVKGEFYQKIPRCKKNSAAGIEALISQNDEAWKRSVTDIMDAWIDEQREKDRIQSGFSDTCSEASLQSQKWWGALASDRRSL
jgi:hypothetical protein